MHYSYVTRVEDQPMTTIEPLGNRDIIPTVGVRTAIGWPSQSSDAPQTRLFWV